MIRNYLKIALRNLWKYKGFSVINISGLSIGIAFSILTMLFIKNELSHDSFYGHQNKLYALATETKQPGGESSVFVGQPAELVTLLRNEVPGIRKIGFGFWGDVTID